MQPLDFFKSLADETRLLSLLLIQHSGELCVCELTEALALSQPKVSRHLANLRKLGLLQDRRQGQWVFYRFDEQLPPWCHGILQAALAGNPDLIEQPLQRLQAMTFRPGRCCQNASASSAC
ncbi:metalloregulator ArsR/SmtB family transcription factor [Shewanella avicenniae]|uniref:metalloregulator ArsR/SmtB family transcription factor n=1 Tax=Shewanella avicenniae TaxID=2814294 RepID=UPI002B47DDC9|nr:metalloregulator ArsR/SmtB family transcription factor [Shewanella avicenniae]